LWYDTETVTDATVELLFTGTDALRAATLAANWYDALQPGVSSASVVQSKRGSSCMVQLSDQAYFSDQLGALFDANASFAIDKEEAFFSDRFTLLAELDLSALQTLSGAKQVQMTVYLPQGMYYTAVQNGKDTISYSGREYCSSDNTLSLTAKAKVLRKDRVILVVLIAFLGLLLLLVVVTAAVRLLLKRQKGDFSNSFFSEIVSGFDAVFRGKMPENVDINGIYYFYGKRGPQILVLLGMVIIPLLWAIFYLLMYRKAEEFYFFSGMLRYCSFAIWILGVLTLPAAWIWRQYQKAPTNQAVGERMLEQAMQAAKIASHQALHRMSTLSQQKPILYQSFVVPDRIGEKKHLVKQVQAFFLRQVSRSFPDIGKPVCVRLESGSLIASRLLLQNVAIFEDTMIVASTCIQPAYEKATPLSDLVIKRASIRQIRCDSFSIPAAYRDGKFFRKQNFAYLKLSIMTEDQKYQIAMPEGKEAREFLAALEQLLQLTDK
jgi:hypothetical protein